jgi:hypothetical protein
MKKLASPPQADYNPAVNVFTKALLQVSQPDPSAMATRPQSRQVRPGEMLMMPTLRFSPMLLLFVSVLSYNLFAQTPKEATATIAGLVTLNGEPVRGVTVTLQLQNPTGFDSTPPPRAKTDAGGRFRITGVPAGQYILGALAPAFVAENDQPLAFAYRLQGKTVNVANGETIENVELKLKRGGVITGRVIDAQGEPVVETNVQLNRVVERNTSAIQGPLPPPMNMGAYRTDDRGVYRLFGLPAGKYKISVGLPARQGAYIPETFHPDTTDEAKAKIIEVEEGQEVTDVDIKAADAQRAFEISGRVVDAETGQPVAGVSLSFATFDQNGRKAGAMYGGWRSDANGEFQIPGARPGKHSVFIEDKEGKSEFYSNPSPFEVINSDVEGIEVRALRGAVISGRVIIEGTNDSALLAKRQQIRIYIADPAFSPGKSRSARVNPDGSFRIVGVPEGKTRLSSSSNIPKVTPVRVEQNGMLLKDSMLEIHPGEQINNVRFVLGFGDGTLRGQVKLVGGELPEGIRLSVRLRRHDPGSSSPIGIPVGPMITLDAQGNFLVKDLVPGEYEAIVSPVYPGVRPSREFVEKFLPRIARTRQRISISNGNESQVTLTVDLSQEN